jgi:hypothetical protein
MWVPSAQMSLEVALTNRTDQEFTQLMKGLQGERLRQAFRYFDQNEDGFIRPDQFKRIMLVRCSRVVILRSAMVTSYSAGTCRAQAFRYRNRASANPCHTVSWGQHLVF